MYKLLISLLYLCVFTGIIVQTIECATIRVPLMEPTIQEGINRAVDGDTVLVAAGVFMGPGNQRISFAGKKIVVISEDGPATCIVDCESLMEGFIFNSGETRECRLEGFTIRNGFTYGRGGGIYCTSSPTIANCIISNNTVEGYCSKGGGIYSIGGPLITGCEISSNSSIDYCGEGGGIYAGGSTVITNCRILDNFAGNNAGGIYCIDSPMIVNCLISGNETDFEGGGLSFNYSCTATMINCTVVNNRAGVGTGFSSMNSSPIVTNCIIYGGIEIIGGIPAVTYCDLRDVYAGPGNIYADPLFTSGFYLSHVAAGQPFNSPCIDAGNAAAGTVCFMGSDGMVCMNQLSTRTDHKPDIGTVDMGYHYPALCVPLFTLPGNIVLVSIISGALMIIAKSKRTYIKGSSSLIVGKSIHENSEYRSQESA